MEKSGFVGGDGYAEDADVVVFEDEMVVGFLGDRDGGGGLCIQRKRNDKQDWIQHTLHLEASLYF
jgi:hypothetical protein